MTALQLYLYILS
uniref:Uncharacterized protein n=1 Tax=Anguilla anguilla TaxID=7936 RepID=A0A0E9RYF6_ANGAN